MPCFILDWENKKVEKLNKKSDFDRKNCFFDLTFTFVFIH